MRRLAAAVGAALLFAALPASAQAPSASGYAFEHPRLLTQQLLWGLAHGVRLLAVTCRTLENGDAAALAYLEWMERHRERIRRATRDLARHYFGRDDASYEALAAAMHLRAMLPHAPEALAPACDTLPEALAAERYDLERFYALHRDAAMLEKADAVRARVARCKGTPDPSALEAAFSAWEAGNAAIESAARDRLERLGDETAARWRREVGQGAVPPGGDCGNLPALLLSPGYGLSHVFGSDDE